MIFSKGMIFIPFSFPQQPTPYRGTWFPLPADQSSFQSSRLRQGEGRGDREDLGSEALPLWTGLPCLPSPPDTRLLAPGLPLPWLLQPSHCSPDGFLTQGRGSFSSAASAQGLLSRERAEKQAEEALESLTGTPSHSYSDPCVDLGKMSPLCTSAGTCTKWGKTYLPRDCVKSQSFPK